MIQKSDIKEKNEINLLKRPFAITDVETTGFDAQMHEIIEIGLFVVNQQTLEIADEFEVKIKPIHIETSFPASLEFNGYKKEDWKDALNLKEALEIYASKTKDALFFAHNVTFDWSFISEAFKKTGIENTMDYHRLDLFTLAWSKIDKLPGLTKFNLAELCNYFDIPKEPKPHRAINGVRSELEVLKKLVQM